MDDPKTDWVDPQIGCECPETYCKSLETWWDDPDTGWQGLGLAGMTPCLTMRTFIQHGVELLLAGIALRLATMTRTASGSS